jgi:copper(I)-binding protein
MRSLHTVSGFAALLLASASLSALAHDFKAGSLTIGHPYARATASGQSTGGGFLSLANAGGADRLLSASADVSASVQLHEMKLEGDVMRMREVDGIALPSGQTVELKPGSYHLMFVGLKAPLKAGTSFPLKLRFQKAGEVTVDVKVEKPQAGGGMQH